MQRWIVAGLVVVAMLLGGALFGYRTIKQNRPHPIWVPVPTNPDLSIIKRDEIIRTLKERLSQPAVLEKVSRDLSLAPKLDLPNDKAAAEDLAKRLFVRAGNMPKPNDTMPAIHIGFNGKSKNHELTGKITMRLMDDVWPILGVQPPKNPAP